MRNGRLLTLAVLAMLTLASQAFAIEKPEEIEHVVKANTPYGKASLSRFLFHIYDVELWTDAAQWSYQSPFALNVTYDISLSAAELTERTLEETQRITPLSPEQKKHYTSYLNRAYRSVKSGDRITAVFFPPNTITFFVNGAETEVVKDTVFAQAFFGIWLSEHTSEPSLRAGLLGLDS